MSEMTHEERLELTRGILNMLEGWEIKASDQLLLLGIKGVPARELIRIRDERAIPDDPDIMMRVEHLISIADALRTTFPFSRKMGSLWMHKPNRKFRQRSPLETMVQDGMTGLICVRSHLDCTFSWDQTGSKS
ncbi:MAG: antitoxin Xre/MbcA/ParS toxin-binding domain-containing protein [Gammaproteobacteria bacterium]